MINIARHIMPIRTLLLLMAIAVTTVVCGHEGVEFVGESPTLPDSVWHDRVTGRQMHLQRLVMPWRRRSDLIRPLQP